MQFWTEKGLREVREVKLEVNNNNGSQPLYFQVDKRQINNNLAKALDICLRGLGSARRWSSVSVQLQLRKPRLCRLSSHQFISLKTDF